MDSLKLVVPPHPTLPPTSQHAQLLSDVQVNNQLRTRADGVWRDLANRPATPMAKYPSKVDVDLGKQGPWQEAPKSRRESTFRTILTAVSDFFKRQRTQNVVAAVAEPPGIDQLRREITVLQNRCANLEQGSYSVYGSCRTSTLDILQGLRKPDAEISQSIITLSEDSESKRATTDVVVQVPAGTGDYSEAKDVDLAIQPTIPPRTAEDGPSSTPLDQNQSRVTPATQDATAPFSQTGHQKLPRKKKEDEELGAEVMVEVEPRSGYIDQQRLPRKKQGSNEPEVETLPPHVHQERLPRKKESDGGRSG